MKKLISLSLALLMLLSICCTGFAEPVQLSVKDAEDQLKLIYSSFSTIQQSEAQETWNYMITDLDHNGRLEVIAATKHDTDYTTDLCVWEVDETGSSLAVCSLNLDMGQSFPDIISDAADCFYEEADDTWHYLFYDNIVLSDQNTDTLKCSVTLKDATISYETFAVQHVTYAGGQTQVSYFDMLGNTISQDQYNAAGVSAYSDHDRSNASFDWFAFADASLSRISDSYAVFDGEKQSGKPAPTPAPNPVPSPVPTFNPAPQPGPLTITKNPTNEYRQPGDTAWFVATANVWTSLEWTMIGTNGVEYPINAMADYFPNCSVTGADGPSLGIGNVSDGLDGFSFYCTFYYNGQSARTSAAYLSVEDAPQPTPPSYNSEPATVLTLAQGIVILDLNRGGTAQVNQSICNMVNGRMREGDQCTVYFYGDTPTSDSIYSVDVYDYDPDPDPPQPTPPSYNSEPATVLTLAQGIVILDLNRGGTAQVSQGICNMVNGSMREGDQCTVYFYGDTPTSDSIYSVDVYDYGGNDGSDDEIPVEWQDWYNNDDEEPVEWQNWDNDDEEPVEFKEWGL